MIEQSLKILLIEGDEPTRELYQRELSKDYQVLACGSENEALAFLHNQYVSVIILEPAMQNGEGWVLLTMLHKMSQTIRTPIILCSTLDERKRGLALGAACYLIKPVLPSDLSEVIHHVIESSSTN